MGNIALDKYLAQLIDNGTLVTGAALLSTAAGTPLRTRNIVLAQKGITFKLPEIAHIVERTVKNQLQLDYVMLGGVQYLITSIQERSFYGVNTNLIIGGGIIVCKTVKSILVITYASNSILVDLAPFVEKFAETLPQ